MTQWDRFYRQYRSVSKAARLIFLLGVILVILCLLSCMIYSELSAASDYAGALLEITSQQGEDTGYYEKMPASEMPRAFLDHYDAIQAAVPEAEARCA